MQKRYGFISGAGGVGRGFAQAFINRGLSLAIQYREGKKEELESLFPKAEFLLSDLKDQNQIEIALRSMYEKTGIIPDAVVLSAGKCKLDVTFLKEGMKKEEAVARSIEDHMAANFSTKKVFIDALRSVYHDKGKVIWLYPISSQAALWTKEEAEKFDEIGYWTSMNAVKEEAERINREESLLFQAHVLFTTNVDTQLLDNLASQVEKHQGGTIAKGENNVVYAERMLVETGFK